MGSEMCIRDSRWIFQQESSRFADHHSVVDRIVAGEAPGKLVDLHEVRPVLGLAQARLATEDELARLFPDCELGAMPPLGPIYGFPVYLDTTLAAQDMICFNAGTHREVLHMRTAEFRRLVSPHIVSLAREPVAAHGW